MGNKNIIFDLIKVFGSNFIALLVGVVNGFLIPKFLGIEEYAVYKTFGLYVSYVGVLSFGFVDGIYIKYGGKTKENVPKNELKSELIFFFIFQLLITVFAVFGALFVEEYILISVALSILPMSIIGFFKLYYQSIGEFGFFAKINSSRPILLLIITLIIIFGIRIHQAEYFIGARIIVPYLIFLFLFVSQLNKLRSVKATKILSRNNLSNITFGIFIMLGNLSNMFFYSMDRWFVKLNLLNEDFAFYSFAISMMSMIMILISSVAMTFYPSLVRKKDDSVLISKVKTYLIIVGSFAACTYFAFDAVVNWFLQEYIRSLDIITILFAGFPAIGVINAIYVNLYKANKVEKRYFFTVVGMAVISFILNLTAILVFKANWTIATATTIAFYVWFFYSSKDFRGTKTNIKEIVYLILFSAAFFSTTRIFTWWIGLPVYLMCILDLTVIFYKQEFLELFRRVFSSLRNSN